MKNYVKPDLFYENFELTVGVAACAIQLNKDGTYKGYYGSNPDKTDLGDIIKGEGGFGNTTVCDIVPDIYSYYGGNDTMSGS